MPEAAPAEGILAVGNEADLIVLGSRSHNLASPIYAELWPLDRAVTQYWRGSRPFSCPGLYPCKYAIVWIDFIAVVDYQ